MAVFCCASAASGAGLFSAAGSIAPMKMPNATPMTPPAAPDMSERTRQLL